MKFHVEDRVFQVLPDYCVGVVVACGIDNHVPNARIDGMLDEAVAAFAEEFKDVNLKEDARIVPFRDAFRKLGINPNKFMCSIEALAKRVQKKGELPHINAVVNVGNAVSLKHCVPIGAHDIEQLENEDMAIRFAVPEDTFVPMGSTDIEKPDENELVYVSGNTVKTRRWTWRQSEDGKIADDTKDVLYPVDGFIGVNYDKVIEARDELAQILTDIYGCSIEVGMIDKANQSFEG